MNSAALFAANADVLFPVHLAVIKYVDFFRRAWAFDEVIAVMDSCRSTNPLLEVNNPPLPRIRPHPNADKVRVFRAFAAGFDQTARERAIDGVTRGIFMAALSSLGRLPGSSSFQWHHVGTEHPARLRVLPNQHQRQPPPALHGHPSCFEGFGQVVDPCRHGLRRMVQKCAQHLWRSPQLAV